MIDRNSQGAIETFDVEEETRRPTRKAAWQDLVQALSHTGVLA
jgi:hypothetical protein